MWYVILERMGVDTAIRSIAHSIGCECPTQSNHQADNLAKLRLEFLSVIKLIAKIFGAVAEQQA